MNMQENNKLNLTNREKWLKKALKKIKKGKKILDAGAGELQYKKYCKHLNYVSQDFNEYTGNNTKEGFQQKKWDTSKIDIVSDIVNIPVKNNSFDAIMCIEVFEHIPEPALAIKEFARILKKNGKVIITAPFCSLTHFAPYYYGNGYSKYWYEKILKDNGFKNIKIDFNGNYFYYINQEINRIFEVSTRYIKGNYLIKLIWLIVRPIVSFILTSMAKNGKNSNELLCFGLHVTAEKK
jgi:ubiquinone/menaquinone biosynthesis C-methylase UbiE